MKKQVCFNNLIKSTLNSDSAYLHLSPETFEKIQDRIINNEKSYTKNYSGLWLKRIVVAACAAFIITTSVVAVSPQARAYAAGIAENFGIKIFRLTDEDMNKLKKNAKTIDVNQMKEGQSETINGITMQRAGQTDDKSSGAVLTEKLDQGVEIEKKIDSFDISEKNKGNLKENSETIDVSELDEKEDVSAGSIKMEKSKK